MITTALIDSRFITALWRAMKPCSAVILLSDSKRRNGIYRIKVSKNETAKPATKIIAITVAAGGTIVPIRAVAKLMVSLSPLLIRSPRISPARFIAGAKTISPVNADALASAITIPMESFE